MLNYKRITARYIPLVFILSVIFLLPFLTQAQETPVQMAVDDFSLPPLITVIENLLYTGLVFILPALFMVNIIYDWIFLRRGKSWKIIVKESLLRSLFCLALVLIALVILVLFQYR